MSCSNLVVVVGAGAAGVSAAISAARSGAEVLLLEKRTSVGGTVAHSLIHTLGGLYDSTGEYLNGGQSVELVERLEHGGGKTRKRQIGKTWVLDVHVDRYQALIKCWLDEIPNIKVVTGVEHIWSEVQGARVEALNYTHNGISVSLPTRAVIDTSGVAEVIGSIDPSLLLADGGHPLAGYIFRLQGVEPEAVSFPRNAGLLSKIRAAVVQGILPPECQTVWLDKGL
ncbi:MAG: FAD-dependent oxidoreductase, partial [Saprospiraceae bacterium]|nr:FAD-dependent oxidoreductase [Saprospiraceae bacterium]